MKYNYPPQQFALFRILFGLYLTIHFLQLLPYADALFSSIGIVADKSLNPSYGAFFSPLLIIDAPLVAKATVVLGLVASIMVMLGYKRRIAAIILWFVWASLLHRNNLILNPGIPMVGWLLLALALIDEGEGWGLHETKRHWKMPSTLFWGAWVISGVAYTISGIDKLNAPSWVDGSAITHLLHNSLARDTLFREWLLSFPTAIHRILTYLVLALEIAFGFLALFRRTRFIAWLGILVMHLGILSIVDFADLTLGVLMLHLFIFDGSWFQKKPKSDPIVFFDGACGFCNKSVQALIRFDEDALLRFAPLGKEVSKAHRITTEDSIVYLEGNKVYEKLDAVIAILTTLGGVGVLAKLLLLLPKTMRDRLYDEVAKRRYLLGGTQCDIMDKEDRKRFLEQGGFG